MNTIEANVDVDTFVRMCWRFGTIFHIFSSALKVGENVCDVIL